MASATTPRAGTSEKAQPGQGRRGWQTPQLSWVFTVSSCSTPGRWGWSDQPLDRLSEERPLRRPGGPVGSPIGFRRRWHYRASRPPPGHGGRTHVCKGGSSLPVLAWAVPVAVATSLNTEFSTGFIGRDAEDLDLCCPMSTDGIQHRALKPTMRARRPTTRFYGDGSSSRVTVKHFDGF